MYYVFVLSRTGSSTDQKVHPQENCSKTDARIPPHDNTSDPANAGAPIPVGRRGENPRIFVFLCPEMKGETRSPLRIRFTKMDTITYPYDDFSRLELGASALLGNYRYFRSLLEMRTKMLVLMKANAYGHGAVQLASLLQQAGANYFAVAYPVEGVELRQSGISLPILVLTAGTDHFQDMIRYGLEPGIPNLYSLKVLCEVLEAEGIESFPVHIKIDTGMHRLGFMKNEVGELCDFLRNHPRIRVESLYSHLAVAEDPSQDEFTLSQITLFQELAGTISDSLGYKPMWHILNSAGIERFSRYQFDMVRLGIGIYGISALSDVRLRPVASLKCKVLQIKTLVPGDGTIGYGRWGKIAPEGTKIVTIPVGYADGIDRHLGRGRASFNLAGHRVKTIGNICMDMCMLDATGVEAKPGDTVTIFGQDPPITELADILDTIPYEILASVPSRIRRVVV